LFLFIYSNVVVVAAAAVATVMPPASINSPQCIHIVLRRTSPMFTVVQLYGLKIVYRTHNKKPLLTGE